MAVMFVGTSVWADPIETIGTTSSGWWTDFSSTYTLAGYGKYHFQFTTTNANDGQSYKTWLLVATNGNDSHGGGGTEYFVWRGDSYAWGQDKNSNAYNAETNASGDPTNLVCSNTYSTANPTGAGLQTAMNGAAVDMVITRESRNIYATATVTPSNGENEFTMSFNYLYGNASSDNIGLFLTVQNAQVVLNTAEQTKDYLKVFSNDFEDAETYTNGWTVSGNSQLTLNGSKYMHLYDNKSASRSFESAVSGANDYVMEFDWNIGQNNGNASGGTVLSVTGLDNSSTITLFTAVKKNAGWSSVFTLQDGSGTDLGTGELTGDGYQKTAAFTFWYHFRLAGNETEGTTLTVTKNAAGSLNTYTSVLATYKLSDDCIAPNGITVTAANRAACAGIDNLFVYSYSTSETVTDPTIDSPVYAGANRTVSITSGISSKGNTVHTYYTLDGTDPTALSTEYSTAVTITENCTLKAITISTTGESSSVVSRAITVGKLTLNAPTFTKTAYSAGNYTVEITSNQSSLDPAPASPVIKYSIDGGSEETYSSAIAVSAGSTVAAHVEADNYNNSSTAELETGIQPNLPVNWTQNYVGKVTGDITLYEDGEGYHNCIVSEAGDNYYVYSSDGTSAFTNANAGFQVYDGGSPRKWMIRQSTGGGGMYNFTAGNAGVAIANLTVGQIVKVEWTTSSYGGFTHNSGVTKLDNISYGSVGYYEVTTDGTAKFTAARNAYVKNITVYDVIVSKTITSAGWATYCSPYALDFSSSITNLTKAYLVTGASGSTLTLSEITGTIPANTGVLLEGEGTVSIPVVASSSTDVSANKLVGVTSNTVIAAEAGYVLMGSPTLGFYLNNKAFTVGANTAYLPASFAAARAFYLFGDDEVTGVNEVIEVKEVNDDSFYDLQGRCVAQPQKGLYIVNGKKVVIK